MRRVVTGLVVLLTLMLCASGVLAKESIGSLTKKLRARDFRVRTQAALKLGTTRSSQAVQPLCDGLSDKNSTVRAAAAAALGKLAKGGSNCLKKRLAKEKKTNVRKMIKKAIRLVAEGATGPSLSGKSKYYLAIKKTTGTSDKDGDVRSAIQKALRSYSGYVFAPKGESSNQAKKRLRKHPHVIGFSLKPNVAVKHDGGRLEVRFVLGIDGYPDSSPMGRIMRAKGFNGLSDDEIDDKTTQLIDELAMATMKEFNGLAASL